MLDHAEPAPLDGVSLLVPPGDALAEHLHVAVPFLLQELPGHTGLVSRARSVQNDEAFSRDLGIASFQLRQRHIRGPFDPRVLKLFCAAYIDEQQPPGCRL